VLVLASTAILTVSYESHGTHEIVLRSDGCGGTACSAVLPFHYPKCLGLFHKESVVSQMTGTINQIRLFIVITVSE
jgi:hypothetical protein